MFIHELNMCFEAYDNMIHGKQRIIITEDNGSFMKDDVLFIREYKTNVDDSKKYYTGRYCFSKVLDVSRFPEILIQDGYCIIIPFMLPLKNKSL